MNSHREKLQLGVLQTSFLMRDRDRALARRKGCEERAVRRIRSHIVSVKGRDRAGWRRDGSGWQGDL